MIHRLDGAAFGARVEELMTTYDPAVTNAQLNVIGSHDAPRALTVMGGDRDALRIATLVQMVLPGAPCIYCGDEIGMEGQHDPDNRRAYPSAAGAGDQALRAVVRTASEARRAHPALPPGPVPVVPGDGG